MNPTKPKPNPNPAASAKSQPLRLALVRLIARLLQTERLKRCRNRFLLNRKREIPASGVKKAQRYVPNVSHNAVPSAFYGLTV
jgi:hypothetical protein